MTTAADRLTQNLVQNGVTVCFANPGTTELHLVKALKGNADMRTILVLFEGVATGACLGYGLLSSHPAASLLHLGVGLSNGLANLHNCQRSFSPTITIVGNHATTHVYNQHLRSTHISRLAQSVSKVVKHTTNPTTLIRDCNTCLRAAMQVPRGNTTLIVPADISWATTPTIQPMQIQMQKNSGSNLVVCSEATLLRVVHLFQSATNTTILLLHGGSTLINREGLLAAAGIESATGCRRAMPCFNSLISRGPTLPDTSHVPYFSEAQVEFFKEIDTLILVNAKPPCAFFSHPDEVNRPGWTLPTACKVHDIACKQDEGVLDGVDFLIRLANALEAPQWSSKEPVPRLKRNTMDHDDQPITPKACSRTMSAFCPDGFVMSNEGNTMGESVTEGLAKYVHYQEIQLVGGAIGQGLPVAIGAAVACPEQKIISIQADGSAMYTIQSLWTMARENLNICIVLLDNAAYNILNVEFERITGTFPTQSTQSMFDLQSTLNVGLDFVALARAQNVTGSRCSTIGAFRSQFEEAMLTKGPHLIHCIFRPSDAVAVAVAVPAAVTPPLSPPIPRTFALPTACSNNTPNAWRILLRAARLWKNQPAIVSGANNCTSTSNVMTYGDLLQQSKMLGHFFIAHGVQQSNRIGILADNVAEVLICHFACAYIGAIIVNMNVRLVPSELAFILSDSTPTFVVATYKYKQCLFQSFVLQQENANQSKQIEACNAVQGVLWVRDGEEEEEEKKEERDHLDSKNATITQFKFEDIVTNTTASNMNAERMGGLISIGGDDPLHLYYTSGTTGRPKGVILSHRALLDHALGAVAEFRMQNTDVWGHFAPLYHVADAFAGEFI